MTLDPYDAIAAAWDELQPLEDPDGFALLLCELIAHYVPTAFDRREAEGSGARPLLVDLGCGSGRLLEALAKRNLDLIGVDRSAAMLAKARERMSGLVSAPLLLEQDLTELDLFGTANIALCLLDTVNHLCEPGALEAFFERLGLFVRPGGCLLFDRVTEEHFTGLADGSPWFDLGEDHALIWMVDYDFDAGRSRADLTWFRRLPESPYFRRSRALIEECVIADERLEQLCRHAGFTEVAVLDGELLEDAAARPPAADWPPARCGLRRILHVWRRDEAVRKENCDASDLG
ncbi:MAG: class I SAM-dependent methyltransferase [Bacillota bacterium]|nr:class I SAM-dependent methyltransferase [Bacillota bacterium]